MLDCAWLGRCDGNLHTEAFWQTLDLIDIEDMEELQEPIGARWIGALAGLALAALIRPWSCLSIVDDRAGLLALAHMSAQVERLAKREPSPLRITARNLCGPQQHDIGAAVGFAIGSK